MTSEKGCRKDKNQNIQVFVRLRPLNQRERDIKSLGVVEVVNCREVVVRQSQQTSHTKRFTFDKAFPPSAKQVEVYQEVVSPLIEEVLNGYNCTVFAYGQTGTGKTHTMVGENTSYETTWQNDPLAGIIPRALSQLFDELRISNTEYTVRVSYLELYNEELFDLLSTSEDNSKLRIYEDVTRKGSNIVNGLEEITVYNKTEVYKIMAQGQERKRVASTLMNAQSSRSHTVFTIVVHMKENSAEGEELVKIGKLNLVDLAGSENISKAGSDNPAKRERARECVNINQSLLTLGRVITALVERHPHIPYRESKLTRILQESLGGRTKTSIIATISPGHKDLEETMSTLEYANRAKNIQNKPEINQKMTKKAILKEYAEEIDRLKRDLIAARDKNGVYLANETFAEMTLKQEEQRKEIQELLLRKRAMEEERDRMRDVFEQLNSALHQRTAELNTTEKRLRNTEGELADTANMLRSTQQRCEEERHIVARQADTERALAAQARAILAAADAAAADASVLLDAADRRRNVESANLEVTKLYRDSAAQHRNNITDGVDDCVAKLTSNVGDVQSVLERYTTDSTNNCIDSKQILGQLAQATTDLINKISSLKTSITSDVTNQGQALSTGVREAMRTRCDSVEAILREFTRCLDSCIQQGIDMDLVGEMTAFLAQWRNATLSDLATLRGTLEAFHKRMEGGIAQRAITAERQCNARKAMCSTRADHVAERINVIMAMKRESDERLNQQTEALELERQETERRLVEWSEAEIKRIEEHVRAERKLLEDRLRRRIDEIESQRMVMERTMNEQLDWLNVQLQECQVATETAGVDLNQNIREAEEDLQSVNKFVVDCETGSNVISDKIETLSESTLRVLENVKTQLLGELSSTKEYVQTESNKLISDNVESMTHAADSTDRMVASMVDKCRTAVDSAMEHIQASGSSTLECLTTVATTMDHITTGCQSHRSAQTEALTRAKRHLEQLHSDVRTELARLADVEERYLLQEYAVYRPTGGTPARTEYRYPRTLAATSPHERILARFRAARQQCNDDDCIMIEDNSESRTSDTDSSASEDSAVAFAALSPPAPPAQTQAPQPITKCTSETDIYIRRRNQDQLGKENANRSMSFKKPSKLPAPAPASHKKPLVERNDN